MSDIVSALGGARSEGFATVEEIGPVGMITLRGAQDSAALQAAVKAAVGVGLPAARRIELDADRGAGWMSPDELLLLLPYAAVSETLAALTQALSGEHALAVDVSDARAVFRIRGPQAREVLMKLCPVDLSPAAFAPGELRRTRAAQVAAAFWISGPDEFTLVSFRSVGRYVFDLLANAAASGSAVGVYSAPT
ncbi:MAG: sarcosine oxidase subunit gamma [Rhodobacteraceae bacterium]|nr:sarcosine oxidase subunit gamma [Paracoccaceae bacterium]